MDRHYHQSILNAFYNYLNEGCSLRLALNLVSRYYGLTIPEFLEIYYLLECEY